mmetsp:Transcript_19862/g.30489  ORF Transcript_19862/g.30489 Transcript_19862/m.30489 type:complete len:184 (-) Transcript_19862:610-1161(-)
MLPQRILCMYHAFEGQCDRSKVGKYLKESVLMDREGNVVSDASKAFGRPGLAATGIDIVEFAKLEDEKLDTLDDLRRHSGKGKAFPTGPKCHFRGKDIPCFCAASESGSITSDILQAALKQLDRIGVYERGPGLPTPMIMLDGHGSRFGVDFMKYVLDPWIRMLHKKNRYNPVGKQSLEQLVR